jgi:multidrug efflux system outer membrane protein
MKWITLLALALASCSLNPSYERPEAPIPSAYPYPASSETAESTAQRDDWRQQFTDPGLQKLIEAALKNNRDLRIAALRMDEARALYGIQSAARFPSVNASGTYSRGQHIDQVSGRQITADQYQAAVSLTAFELDFFGRVRSLSQAALSQYFATEEAHRAAQISLVANVATTYIRELGLAQQERLAQDTLKAREDSFQLNQSRLKAGVTGVLELRTAEMLTETSRARLAAVRRERAQMQNALRILVGSFDFAFEDNKFSLDTLQFPAVQAGVPSTLLERRPDIRQAEHLLLAANANIGAARAAFFPSLSLTASMGTVSEDLAGLFKSGTEVWNFTPQLNLPIFAGGRNRANLDLAHVRKHVAIIQYEQAIQNAFREVMDALTARDHLVAQVNAQKAVTDADRERAHIAQLRYDKGVSNYLEYLDSQRSLFESEQEYLRLHELRLTNDIALYKALGGGWEPASGQ